MRGAEWSLYGTPTHLHTVDVMHLSDPPPNPPCAPLPYAQRTHLEYERALISVFPFTSYMLAEGLSFSGVVAILFTGTCVVWPGILADHELRRQRTTAGESGSWRLNG